MTKLETLSTVLTVLGVVIGAVGGTVGIVTSILSSRREANREIEELNNFAFLAAFMQKQIEVGGRVGRIFTSGIEIGSDSWRRAEKLVERGILERGGPNGLGYRIRGFYETDPRRPARPPSE